MTNLPIPPLTPEERIQARQTAAAWVIQSKGAKPKRADFDRHTASKYPPSVTRTIRTLALILLAAAFIPSAMRLYSIGATTFRAGMKQDYSIAGEIVGFMTILLAETGQVVFSLALATFTGSRQAKLYLYFGTAISTIIALTGNIELALIDNLGSPFAWLEAIAPPLIVLSTAYVLKEQFLEVIQQRHADQRAYEETTNKYLDAISDPESDSLFSKYFAEAIKLAHANKRGQITEARKLSREQWIAIVNREMYEESWWMETDEESTPEPAPTEEATQEVQAIFQEDPFPAAANGNGHQAHTRSG